ncbi:SDR family NAD(P)-dependent oxidoreductase [Pelodictyon phaeoclathratiforme]|jgi:3-oxoacyl-[acyl-carrier protein] reductase|uniref:Short-chain dehydrogenase/reductase SDR n=1 Tax=Pelodictyon phaeoclathratiforme (strain DSM 5477 / BU-1) TaxID=324925 RepID=B4SAV9_PELPB|nr:SDR family NAD(P)-dependent oxidoreductase [Pelodictyon phaeoclathratiforme]ACF43905.1 short-chain dehydrogenase/reductase SDR [Pelodictyon phaeoclathratiforme BU-1]MBV5288416.1 SDR family oxidoreductase [Pelodictyon phaeoclathratiforme]
MRLFEKIALVTGAAGGIGRAVALCFAGEGAVVIVSDINATGCAETLEQLERKGGSGMSVIADVTQEEEILALYRQTGERYGRLDIVVNIAGGDCEPAADVEGIDYLRMSANLDLNLKSCIISCREAARLMKPQGFGKIVNMSSLVYRGSPNQFSYAAAKGGIYAFTRSLALSLGRYGITANALAPALVEVPAFVAALGPERWEMLRRECAQRYPLGRVATPDDVARCALFLASADADFITGQILEISGGARL